MNPDEKKLTAPALILIALPGYLLILAAYLFGG
jgi:hypothetical protein